MSKNDFSSKNEPKNVDFFSKNVAGLLKVDEPLGVAMQKVKALNGKPLRFMKIQENSQSNQDFSLQNPTPQNQNFSKNQAQISQNSPQNPKKFTQQTAKTPQTPYNLFDLSTKNPMYSDLMREFNEKKAEFNENFPKHPVIFLFGFGNGELIKWLLENPHHKRVIVFECELEPIFFALQHFDCSQALKDERLILFYEPNLNSAQLSVLFGYKDISIAVKTLNFNINCDFYERHFDTQIKATYTKLAAAARFCFIQRGNDSKDSLIGINHTLLHLPKMLARPSLQTLLKSRKKATKNAIIVSTGPSLTKQLPLLKQVASKASIFCADSAYAILQKHDIKPDYVLSIERVPMTAELFNNDFKGFDEDIIFVVASYTHPKTIEYLEKNKRNFIISLRPGLFTRSLKLDEFGFLGVGHSVSNMSCELAAYLEHENIALIGQDLAYSNAGVSHSHEYSLIGHHAKDFERDRGRFLLTAYGGVGLVHSSAAWVLFKQGLENDIQMARVKYQTTTYNCTEGGARIEGAVELAFKEFCERFLGANLALLKGENLGGLVENGENLGENSFKKAKNSENSVNFLENSLSKQKNSRKFAKNYADFSALKKAEQKRLLKQIKGRFGKDLKRAENYLESVKAELITLSTLLPRNYDFAKLDFKALYASKKRLKKLHERFTKSVIFTEISDVIYYQNNCELVRLDCLPCKDEKATQKVLVQWLETMGNWFIEVSDYLYAQDERIKFHINEWEL